MTAPPDPSKGVSAQQVYRSGAIAVVIAWSMRLIGLVSVFVLARTLTPADFGIVALALATLAIVDVFSALGLRQALLRVKDPDESYYNTVWTIQLLVLIFLAIVAVALGPVVAWIYEEPALSWVLAALATRFVFFGLANIGIIDFERNLEFGRDLRFRLAVRLSTFVVTVGAAIVLQNYWALVIGGVSQGVIHCIASYIVHPFRPRLSLARRAEMLRVSIWMFLASAAYAVSSELERIVVGRIANLDLVGSYSVSKGLASIFTEEVATALNRVTFVTTARTQSNLGAEPVRMQSLLGAYAMIAAPLGLGLAATSANSVHVLLGDQWASAAPYLALIAPAAALFAVFKLITSSLQASGKAKLAAMLAIAAAAAICAVTVVMANGGQALDIAQAILITNASILVCAIVILAVDEKANVVPLLLAPARPFAAAVIMYIGVVGIAGSADVSLVILLQQAALGAAIYAASLPAIWAISGRPQGAETIVYSALLSRVSNRTAKGSDAF